MRTANLFVAIYLVSIAATTPVQAQSDNSKILICTVKEANPKAPYKKDSTFNIPLSALKTDGDEKNLIYKNISLAEYLTVSRQSGDFLFLVGQFNRIESLNDQGVMKGNCVPESEKNNPQK